MAGEAYQGGRLSQELGDREPPCRTQGRTFWAGRASINTKAVSLEGAGWVSGIERGSVTTPWPAQGGVEGGKGGHGSSPVPGSPPAASPIPETSTQLYALQNSQPIMVCFCLQGIKL